MNYINKDVIAESIRLLGGSLILEKIDIPVWRTRTALYTADGTYTDFSPWEEITRGTDWTCRFDEARFFEAEVTVPASMEGQKLVLELSLGGEGIVSINGRPHCGATFWHNPAKMKVENRERVFLTENGKAGETYRISFQTNMNYKDAFKAGRMLRYTTDFSQNYSFRFARLCSVDRETEAYYFDLVSVWDEYQTLLSPTEEVLHTLHTRKMDPALDKELLRTNRDQALLTGLGDALQQSILCIPFFDGAEAIRRAVPEAQDILWKRVGEITRGKEGRVIVTGFSHIDIVWLWRLSHTFRKIATTMLNALDLMEQYPEMTFTASQPYAFALLKEHYPDIFERVRQKVAEGRLIPVGNLWIELDTNMPSGESVVRQLLYGRQFYLENFGFDSDIFFMPDSFGYSAALPQILTRSGIRFFYSAKLPTNEYYLFPHTLMRWQGIDGTTIPAYLQRVPYNGRLNAARLESALGYVENRHLTDTVMIPFGYGDGGGGPLYSMMEQYRRIPKLPGIPNVEMGTYDSFYETVCQKEDEFPIWNDEIYLDRHRGVLTSHGDVKKNNRHAELLLRQLGMAASLRELLLGIPYPADTIRELWKQMLVNQAHDTLPGDSVTLVFEDVAEDYEKFFAKAKPLFAEVIGDLSAHVRRNGPAPVYWNFLSWPRKALRGSGEKGYASLPSLGWSAEAAGAAVSEGVSSPGERCLENRFFLLKLAEDGTVESIYDKENHRQVLRQPGNVLEVYRETEKSFFSAHDIEKVSLLNKEELREADSIRLTECGADRGVLRVERSYRSSRIVQDIVLYAELPRIDFVTHIDWQEKMRLLKTAFCPNVHANRAAYEIQFGAIERPTHRNTDYDSVRFEACGHKWADLSQQDFGVSLLNDCKYGYDIHEGVMRLSLLRSPVEPDYKSDIGPHDFTYSLYPHAGNWGSGRTVQAGYELNVPAACCEKAPVPGACLEAQQSFLSVSGSQVVLDTFKKAEDGRGYILRFYEAAGGGGEAEVSLLQAPVRITECNLMEQDEKQLAFNGNTFRFETAPYRIHSFRVEF